MLFSYEKIAVPSTVPRAWGVGLIWIKAAFTKDGKEDFLL